MPWWLKFGGKIATGALGLGRVLHVLGVYSHGRVDVSRHYEVFSRHYDAVQDTLPEHFTMLELGPGYSLASAVFAAAAGAKHTYFVDEGAYAHTASIEEAQRLLRTTHGSAPDSVAYTYLTEGLVSLARIPDASIDFIFSNSVLEHVRKDELLPLMRECRRVLAPGGVCSHWIDLKDHLGASLHSLRFSEAFWEGPLVARAGFYTNRLRYSQLRTLFTRAGFACRVLTTAQFTGPTLQAAKLHPQFRALSEKDLTTAGMHVLLNAAEDDSV